MLCLSHLKTDAELLGSGSACVLRSTHLGSWATHPQVDWWKRLATMWGTQKAHCGSSGWSNSLGQMMAAWCARLCLISFLFPHAMCCGSCKCRWGHWTSRRLRSSAAHKACKCLRVRTCPDHLHMPHLSTCIHFVVFLAPAILQCWSLYETWSTAHKSFHGSLHSSEVVSWDTFSSTWWFPDDCKMIYR